MTQPDPNTYSGEDGYLVRLVMALDAAGPADAVDTFVEMIVENGLVNWIYRVEAGDSSGVILGYFNGHGEPVDVDALLETDPDAQPEPNKEDQTPIQTAEPGNDDAALLDLATSISEPATEEQPQDEPQEQSAT